MNLKKFFGYEPNVNCLLFWGLTILLAWGAVTDTIRCTRESKIAGPEKRLDAAVAECKKASNPVDDGNKEPKPENKKPTAPYREVKEPTVTDGLRFDDLVPRTPFQWHIHPDGTITDHVTEPIEISKEMTEESKKEHLETGKVICPECKKHGIKSTVTEGGCLNYAVYCPVIYGSDGVVKYNPDCGGGTCEYTCSEGHAWKM